LRRHIQFIFQDPFGSLDPRMTVGDSIMEPLLIHGVAKGAQAQERVRWLMDKCGLAPDMIGRYPHEFSGGQRQRIAIARALVLKPKLLLLDEPTSALDATLQKQIIALLLKLQREHGLSYLFISHDLAVIRALAHRVIVLKDGEVVEAGETGAVLSAPQSPYTRALLAAARLGEMC
jgi:peptide/nickel transport system ATP-binding protein